MNIDWKTLGITAGILFAAYKFSGNALVKGAAVSIAAVVVAKQIPFVKDAIA